MGHSHMKHQPTTETTRASQMTATYPNSPVRPYPTRYASPWTMRDQTQITIRPICPEDEPRMVQFHETLSDRTVYMRYFSSMKFIARVSHERLFRICHSDYEHEMVLVAEHTDSQTGERRILAVGRLNRLQANGEAEVAVLVSDEYQHKGI